MICETMAGDNRFEIIAKAKHAILDSTNIETDEDEMKVLDNILFRCWQMGWLDKYGNQQPDGDTISRQDAVKEIDSFCGEVWTESEADFARGLGAALSIVESLPSAEQVTGKLNNPDDSLLTAYSKACKEQKSKLDLISRQDAVASIKEEYFPSVDDYGEGYNEALNKAIWILEKWLPSAETPTVSEKHQLSVETPTNTPTDLISRRDVLNMIIVADECEPDLGYTHLHTVVENIPSAEVEDRLYIKIYADDEPSVMAEKLYQICGETQNGEVAEWLKEYFPSAPDSRRRGEWYNRDSDGTWATVDFAYCSECKQPIIHKHASPLWHFCPNCGADMRGGEEDDKKKYL